MRQRVNALLYLSQFGRQRSRQTRYLRFATAAASRGIAAYAAIDDALNRGALLLCGQPSRGARSDAA